MEVLECDCIPPHHPYYRFHIMVSYYKWTLNHILFQNVLKLSVVAVVESLSHVWLCDPMNCNMLGFPVHHHLWEFTQVPVHWAVMPSDHFILCHSLLLSLLFPIVRSFLMSWLFASGDQCIGTSASASVLPINIQDWFPLGLTGLISV